MNTDDLDDRIRTMVASAVSDAPPAPELPTRNGTTNAVVMPLETRRRRPVVWVLGGAAAAAMLVGVVLVATDDDSDRITGSSSTVVETTTPGPTTTDSTATSIVGGPFAWPPDVVGIIASERGVERVYADGDGIVVSQDSSTPQRPLDVAFELPDGEVLAGGSLMDVSPFVDERLEESMLSVGTPWVYTGLLSGDNLFPLDVQLPEGVTGGIARLTHGLDIYVGQTVEEGGWWRPLLFHNGIADTQFWEDLGVAGPFNPQLDPPRLFSVSATGSTIAWVQSSQLFLDDGRVFDIPDGSKVIELDMTDDFIALSRASTVASLLDLRTGTWYDAPALGRLTISFRAPDATGEPVPTTSEAPPTIGPGNVVTAGPDGVWEQAVDGWVQWTSEPMALAVKAPDGSMIMQRTTEFSTQDPGAYNESVPLTQAEPGAPITNLFDLLGPGADPAAGWYRIHDAAVVDGRSLLLIERQAAETSGVETPNGALMTLDLDSGEFTTIADQFGGWEWGHSRMHLAENGLIIGESYSGVSRSYVGLSIGSVPAPTPDQLMIEPEYGDCFQECPRLFSVSRDGSEIAWVQDDMLCVWTAATGGNLCNSLSAELINATDLVVA